MRDALSDSNALIKRLLPAWVVYLLAWPHEFCHYAVASLLGVGSKIVPGAVEYNETDPWREALIIGAPIVVGLFLIPAGWWWVIWWWAGCACDFIDLYRLARKNHWP